MFFLFIWWFLFFFISCHVLLDIVCTVCCLWGNQLSFWATLYVSIFRDPIDNENETLMRVMVYWTGSMSLVRLLAVVLQTYELFCAVSVLYALEALVAEFEGFGTGTVTRRTARMISLLSFALSFAILIVMCIIPSLYE